MITFGNLEELMIEEQIKSTPPMNKASVTRYKEALETYQEELEKSKEEEKEEDLLSLLR